MKDITLRLAQHRRADDAGRRPYSARYAGSMVADVELAEDFVAGRSPEPAA
jgi:fructose-1,6-bisphosphatase